MAGLQRSVELEPAFHPDLITRAFGLFFVAAALTLSYHAAGVAFGPQADRWEAWTLVLVAFAAAVMVVSGGYLLLKRDLDNDRFRLTTNAVVPTRYGRPNAAGQPVTFEDVLGSSLILMEPEAEDEPSPFVWKLETRTHGRCVVDGYRVVAAIKDPEEARELVARIVELDATLRSRSPAGDRTRP